MKNLRYFLLPFFMLWHSLGFSHGTSNLEGRLRLSTQMTMSRDSVQLTLYLTEIEKGALNDLNNVSIKIDSYNNGTYMDMTPSGKGQYTLKVLLKEGKFNLRVWLKRKEKSEIGMNGFTISSNRSLISESESELWFVPKGSNEPIIWLDNLSGIVVGFFGLLSLLFLLVKRNQSFLISKYQKPNILLYLATLAAISMPFGAYWDISLHSESGRESFFQAPHLLIYGGILICMLIIAISLGKKEKELNWKQYLQKDKAVMIALIAILLQISSGPFDEIWHNAFGLDVSVWSPPHVVLIFGGVAVCISLSMLAVKTETIITDIFRALTLAGALLIVEVFLAEFEFPMPSWHISQSRPYWVYFSLLILFAVIIIMIAKIRINWKLGATLSMSMFLFLRLSIYPFLDLVERSIQPKFPFWIVGFILLGLLFDFSYRKRLNNKI